MIREFKKEELEMLYDKYGSVRKVAKFLNVPRTSMCCTFNKLNIDSSKKIKIKKDILKRMFNELGSVHKVAERLGEAPSSIYYYMDKYGIDTKKKRFPYTKKELIKLHEECGSITKVAAKLSRNYSTVRYWYNAFDIVVNKSGMTVYHELRNTPMSDIHKSVLIGSMLGDGGIWLAPHCINARLYVCHCEKQMPYLKWINDLLQPFSRPIVQTEKAGKKMFGDKEINGSNFYRFYTIAHPDITKLFRKYYRKTLKGVDRTLIDEVDLLAMSIWFADDGWIERNKKREPISCGIATNSFTYKEHLVIVDIVRKFFNGKIQIVKQGGYYKGVKREDFRLRMSGKEHVNDFLDMIKLVLPECIHYKLS